MELHSSLWVGTAGHIRRKLETPTRIREQHGFGHALDFGRLGRYAYEREVRAI